MTLRNLTPVVCLAFLVGGCGGHKSPGGPSATPPQITCPSDISIHGVATPSQAVTFDAPVVTGGAAPLQTTGTPAAGAYHPHGATTVYSTAAGN
jgi:hypothetical protein